jgi:hypothetical protein
MVLTSEMRRAGDAGVDCGGGAKKRKSCEPGRGRVVRAAGGVEATGEGGRQGSGRTRVEQNRPIGCQTRGLFIFLLLLNTVIQISL